jgi:hypothetical protein
VKFHLAAKVRVKRSVVAGALDFILVTSGLVVTQPIGAQALETKPISLPPLLPPNKISTQDPVHQATEALSQWRRDWENRDLDRFSKHYADGFQSGDLDRQAYLERKRGTFEKRPWQRIQIQEMLWIAENGSPNALSVRFIQDYQSPQASGRSRKEQRWVRSGSRWQIASESEVAITESDTGRPRVKSITAGNGK